MRRQCLNRPNSFEGCRAGEMKPVAGLSGLEILLVNTRVARNTKQLVAGVRTRHNNLPKVGLTATSLPLYFQSLFSSVTSSRLAHILSYISLFFLLYIFHFLSTYSVPCFTPFYTCSQISFQVYVRTFTCFRIFSIAFLYLLPFFFPIFYQIICIPSTSSTIFPPFLSFLDLHFFYTLFKFVFFDFSICLPGRFFTGFLPHFFLHFIFLLLYTYFYTFFHNAFNTCLPNYVCFYTAVHFPHFFLQLLTLSSFCNTLCSYFLLMLSRLFFQDSFIALVRHFSTFHRTYLLKSFKPIASRLSFLSMYFVKSM
jgi:hypothetical protein